MNAARIVIVAVLLPLAISGALILSASATMNLFGSQGVTVAWAAVGMLEVTALAGTLLWVLVGNRSLRRDAIAVTCGATGVALVAGVFAYGPVGAVAGVLLVALTHLASRAWREDWAAPQSLEFDQPRTVQDLVDDAAAVEPAPEEPLTRSGMRDLAYGDAARWGEREIRAGGTAGLKKLRGQFPQLSEHFAGEASKEAKRLAEERPVRVAR